MNEESRWNLKIARYFHPEEKASMQLIDRRNDDHNDHITSLHFLVLFLTIQVTNNVKKKWISMLIFSMSIFSAENALILVIPLTQLLAY